MPRPPVRRGALDDLDYDFEGGGEQARDWLESAYGTALGLGGPMGTVRHRRAEGDGVAFDHLRIDSPVTFDAEAMPVLVVVDVLAGHIEYRRDGVTDRGRSGDTLLAAGWGRAFAGSGTGYGVRNTSLSGDALAAAIAEVDADATLDALVFTGFTPRSPAAGARWRTTVDELGPISAGADVGSIARAEAARLLGHTLLQTFANTVVDRAGGRARERSDATAAAVRRAQAVIESRAHEDLSLADLAREARVAPRSLQYAFRQHLGLSPLAYLRQVRLDLVHQALVDGTAISVGDVAGRYGFFNPGRFAAEYRALFGENPGQTFTRSTS